MFLKTTLIAAMSSIALSAAIPAGYAADRHSGGSKDKVEHADRHHDKSGDRNRDRQDAGSIDPGGDK